jgi:glycosyltransferase involved in cell wall biosynthesis
MAANEQLRRPLTVLHCRASFARHGPEQALDQLLPALREQAIEPRVLALYRAPTDGPATHPWVTGMRAAGFVADQVPDPGPLSLGVVRRLRRRVMDSGADILHTHDYKTNVLGGLAARRAEKSMPWVATVHLHTRTTRRLRIYRALDLFLLRLADRVITVSRDQRRMLLERGVDRRRLVLIPNVIDASGFAASAGKREDTRAALGLLPEVPVAILVGRLTAQKAVDCFLTVASAVSDVRPDARFLIVGDGPERPALDAQTDALGISDNVLFLGYREDVPSLLLASDVFVLSSLAEGLPLALLEAMAVGLPVVASRVGGVPDVVRGGENGILVRPGMPLSLAEGMLELMEDPEQARRLGEAGRQHVCRSFGPSQAARRMAAVYRTGLAERG